MLTGLVKSFCI